MKNKILLKLAETLLPKLLDIAVLLLEEVLKIDINEDGKIGR